MKRPLTPPSFKASRAYHSGSFYFRPFAPDVAEQDYEAVISSQQSLQGIFGPNSDWPRADLTLAQNTKDAEMHFAEFEAGEAFVYSIFDDKRCRCLGTVYIDPSELAEFDCEVQFWLRDDSKALLEPLYQTIIQWLENDWPFEKIRSPQIS